LNENFRDGPWSGFAQKWPGAVEVEREAYRQMLSPSRNCCGKGAAGGENKARDFVDGMPTLIGSELDRERLRSDACRA